MPEAVPLNTTSRRTFLVGMAAAAAPIAALPAGASGAGSHFRAAVDRYRHALAELNASPLEDEDFDAAMDEIIDPLEDRLSSIDLATPADAVEALDIVRDHRGPLSEQYQEQLLDRLHDYLRRAAQ
ncbi:hypothetical protein RUR49_19240 [Pseudoxanthobacter sp. M-2]|uniref:hypothetical protein n=1 Tax=Pseudoxanthobacter sp. M-2 TaxID=3078754 RepID=UPI0038FCBA1D